ncbi:MAG: nicotinate-nucleotide adenylyltransferase [Chitinophagales bacterium]|nr:nicotinate-nucleotide adenylyltransferase [Chitinophagales bacterium]
MMTGLFFGSFNPIHTGHLIIANYLLEYADLEEVWFIVSPQNPLKQRSQLADPEARFKMAQLAIEGNKKFKVSRVEFNLPLPSYTINTLQYLRKKYPVKNFSIIMGSDSLQSIRKWKDYQEILENFTLFIYKRSAIPEKKWSGYKNIKWFDVPLVKISSTAIREMITSKRSVRYLVPDKVLSYINQHRMYTKT